MWATRLVKSNSFFMGAARRALAAAPALPGLALPGALRAPAPRGITAMASSRLRTQLPAAAAAHAIAVPGFIVTSPHARVTEQSADDYMLSHAVYTAEEVKALKTDVHFPPATLTDRAALAAITLIRKSFDFVSGYSAAPGSMKANDFLVRAIFLETVAAVPGMVASMVRHFESLRLMRRDNGWIHTLLAEAENERMHLLTFLELKKPGFFMRLCVLGAQGVFFNFFFLAYLLHPTFCHRLVGFLEEEAVHTYTRIIEDMEAGHLEEWRDVKAPPIAIKYWRLPADAMLKDVILAIRADEAIHRDVNVRPRRPRARVPREPSPHLFSRTPRLCFLPQHVFASLKKEDPNPFI